MFRPWQLHPSILYGFLLFGVTPLSAQEGRRVDTLPSDVTAAKSTTNSSIHVPEGFTVEMVAAPPLVEHPMMACLDDQGRLYVAESVGVNLKAEELLASPPHRIRRLEDTDGDGRFDRSILFADKMSLPMGVLWYRGALYCASPPSLWRLEDRDGDGQAEARTEIVTRFGFTGNAADIHGPFLGPDGWIYWTDGRHGHTIERPNGPVMTGKAARIFRCRPDGTEVEVVCGGGMDNPVEVAFTDEGEPFATVDILISRPSRIDAIIYVIEGGTYPHYEPVLNEFKRTGDLLPAVSQLGWVAPAGLMRYRDDGFGASYRDNLFSAQFNMRRVQRHPLEREGASFRLTNEDFLVSDDPDFHPTDVLQAGDGSLFVINTGGWFRIGCPTSQVAKPEIKGAIYRVRRTGQTPPKGKGPEKLDWEKATPEALVTKLDAPEFLVRDRAIEELALRGGTTLPVLAKTLESTTTSETSRRNAVWALSRIKSSESESLLSNALRDASPSVRLAASHVVGVNRIALASSGLLSLLKDAEPAVRRNAATALGRLRHREAIPALLDAMQPDNDRFLDHALIYALIEMGDRQGVAIGLASASPDVRRGALVALDQMEGGNLERGEVIPLAATTDKKLQHAVFGIIARHPDWAEDVLGLIEKWTTTPALNDSSREGLRETIRSFAANTKLQELVARGMTSEQVAPTTRLLLIEASSTTTLGTIPTSWVAAYRQLLAMKDHQVVGQTLGVIRALGITALDKELIRIGRDPSQPTPIRVGAWSVVTSRMPEVSELDFSTLTDQLRPETEPLLRLAAAEALGKAKLNDRQRLALALRVSQAGSLELPRLIVSFEGSADPAVASELIKALEASPGLESLSTESLNRALAAFPAEARQGASPLFKRLNPDQGDQVARLARLEPLLKGGDPKRGRTVFFGKTAACFACHTIKGEGGRIGPDLSKIGSIRSGRDLLEAIAFPSVSLVRGYEPYVLALKDGRTLSGTIGRETVDSLFLNTTDAVEIQVPRNQVEDLQQSRDSIMPKGLDTQMSPGELADLLSYLQQLK